MEKLLKLNKQREKEVKDFLENYQEEIEEIILEDYDIEEEAQEMFDSDMNYKHCDPTTRQRCLELDEIEDFIKDSIQFLKSNIDRCSYCGIMIKDEDWITDTQNHPYGDSYATETICTGYNCNSCGEEENF